MSQTYVLTQNITRSLDWLGHVTQMDCQHTAQVQDSGEDQMVLGKLERHVI